MSYKDILVYLDDGASNPQRVQAALAMAKIQEARLTGVVVNATPTLRAMMRLGINGGGAVVEKTREAAGQIASGFSEQAAVAGVEHATRIIECTEGQAGQKVAHLARNYDLAIMRQANPDRPNADLVLQVAEGVLFSSGRPAFFIPYIGAHRIPCRRAVVAWDGSAAATRAVHDALPLMGQMEEVIILVVDDDKQERTDGARPGDDIAAHLGVHGINCRVERMLSGGAPTSTIILNQLYNDGADILIMGGYGTAKLREVVLGGVTRTIMNTMTVPVFMSH